MPGSRDSLGLDLDQRVVAQIELIEPAVGRVDPDRQQDVRRLLLGRHAGCLDDVGQKRLASATRFWTSTCARFMSMPCLKVTVRL